MRKGEKNISLRILHMYKKHNMTPSWVVKVKTNCQNKYT